MEWRKEDREAKGNSIVQTAATAHQPATPSTSKDQERQAGSPFFSVPRAELSQRAGLVNCIAVRFLHTILPLYVVAVVSPPISLETRGDSSKHNFFLRHVTSHIHFLFLLHDSKIAN